jgi:predicted Fe-Mo cluster-binding NifX family protein
MVDGNNNNDGGNTMLIAISTMSEYPESLVHPQFGRCGWFVVFDETRKLVKIIKNSYAAAETGAGIGCAQDLIQEGVKVVISGQVGPKAYEVLKKASMDIYLAPPDISAHEALNKFLLKNLQRMEIRTF